MPERAEVQVFCDALQKNFGEASILNIEYIGGRFLKENQQPIRLPLNNIEFNTRGKILFVRSSDSNVNLYFTLGMTGSFSPKQGKHSAIKFETSKGDFFFDDIRHFGTFRILNYFELENKLNKLKWDPLKEEYSQSIIDYIKKFSNKDICTILLNQDIFSGVGNYLRAEILYDSKISPFRKIENLTDIDIVNILKSTKKIVKESYLFGGASLYTFKNFGGVAGNYFDQLKVYNKKTTPEGFKVLKSKNTMDGRSIYFCPDVQI